MVKDQYGRQSPMVQEKCNICDVILCQHGVSHNSFDSNHRTLTRHTIGLWRVTPSDFGTSHHRTLARHTIGYWYVTPSDFGADHRTSNSESYMSIFHTCVLYLCATKLYKASHTYYLFTNWVILHDLFSMTSTTTGSDR